VGGGLGLEPDFEEVSGLFDDGVFGEPLVVVPDVDAPDGGEEEECGEDREGEGGKESADIGIGEEAGLVVEIGGEIGEGEVEG